MQNVDYNAFAETFASSRKGKSWEEIDEIIQFLKNHYSSDQTVKILDLGCGNGRLYPFLQEAFPHLEYTGADIAEKLLQIAKNDHGDFFQFGDLRNLSSFDTYDVIISIAAFHHLPTIHDREVSLQNIHEHLADDGIFAMTNWDLLSPYNEKYHKSMLYPGEFSIKIGEYTRYYHGFKRKELSELLKKAGFKEIQPTEFDSVKNFVCICKKA